MANVKQPRNCETLQDYLRQLRAEQTDGNVPNVPAKYVPWVLMQLGYSEDLKLANVAEREPNLWQQLLQRFPGYNWDDHCTDAMAMTRPTVQGNYLSFATLVLMVHELLNVRVDPFSPRVMARASPLLQIGPLGERFVQMLVTLGVDLPLEKETQQLVNVAQWLQRAASGERSTVLCVVCPDYSYDANRCYTFDELWCGVGIVAQHAVDSLPLLVQFALAEQLPVEIVVATADFEGDSESTRQSVGGLSEEEFRQCCQLSTKAIGRVCDELLRDSSCSVRAVMFSDIISRGERERRALLVEQMLKGGHFRLPNSMFQQCWAARLGVLKRWYGEDEAAVREAFWGQATQYGMVGSVARTLPNCLVLGAEVRDLSPFLCTTGQVPYIYLPKVSY